MPGIPLKLVRMDGLFAICRLGRDAAIPAWATAGDFFSVTRTADELSIVCSTSAVPDGVQVDAGWRCLRVAGAMSLSLVGVLASLTDPLAVAGISVFAISTFDTDYLLLKETVLEAAIDVLRRAGHEVESKPVASEVSIHNIRHLVEAALYVVDLEEAEAFYRNALGLELIGKAAGRHVFFRVGDGVLLLFNPEETTKGDLLPRHGAKGPGHVALGIAVDAVDQWRARLAELGVPIEKEMAWPKGGNSLYFRDPSGNAVELVTPGCWGLPSGW